MNRSLGRNWLRVQIETLDVIEIANEVMAFCDHFVCVFFAAKLRDQVI